MTLRAKIKLAEFLCAAPFMGRLLTISSFLVLFLAGYCSCLQPTGTFVGTSLNVAMTSVGAANDANYVGTLRAVTLANDATGNSANLTAVISLKSKINGETEYVSMFLEGVAPTVTSSPDLAVQLLPTWDTCVANSSFGEMCLWAFGGFGDRTFDFALYPGAGHIHLLVSGFGNSAENYALKCLGCADASANSSAIVPGTYSSLNLDIPLSYGPSTAYSYSLFEAYLVNQPYTTGSVQLNLLFYVTPRIGFKHPINLLRSLVGASTPPFYVDVSMTGYLATVGSAGGVQCATEILPVWQNCTQNNTFVDFCSLLPTVMGNQTFSFTVFPLATYTATGLIVNQWGPLTYNLQLVCSNCDSTSGVGQCAIGGGGGGGNGSINLLFNGGLTASPNPVTPGFAGQSVASLANFGTATYCQWANLRTDSKGRVSSCQNNSQPVLSIVAGSSLGLTGQVTFQNNGSNPNVVVFSNPSGQFVQATLPTLPPSPLPAQYARLFEFPASMLRYFFGDDTTSCTYCSIVRDAYGRIASMVSNLPVTSISAMNGVLTGAINFIASPDMTFIASGQSVQGFLTQYWPTSQVIQWPSSITVNPAGAVTAFSSNTPVISFNGADGPVAVTCDGSCSLTQTSPGNFALHSNGGGGGGSVPFITIPYQAQVNFATAACFWPGNGANMRPWSQGQITYSMTLMATRYIGAGPTDPNYGITQVTANFYNFNLTNQVSLSDVDHCSPATYMWGSSNQSTGSSLIAPAIPTCFLPNSSPGPWSSTASTPLPSALFFPTLMADGSTLRQFGWWIYPSGVTGAPAQIEAPGAIAFGRIDQGSGAFTAQSTQILGPTYPMYSDGGATTAGGWEQPNTGIGYPSQLSFSWTTVVTDTSCDQGPPLPATNCSYVLSASSLAFGSVTVGSNALMTVYFFNNGDNGYIYGGYGITGANPSEWTESVTNCSGTLGADDHCYWTLEFSPGSAASFSATFQPLFSCNGTAAVIDVYLSGTGVPVPTTPPPTTTPTPTTTAPATTTPPPTTIAACGFQFTDLNGETRTDIYFFNDPMYNGNCDVQKVGLQNLGNTNLYYVSSSFNSDGTGQGMEIYDFPGVGAQSCFYMQTHSLPIVAYATCWIGVAFCPIVSGTVLTDAQMTSTVACGSPSGSPHSATIFAIGNGNAQPACGESYSPAALPFGSHAHGSCTGGLELFYTMSGHNHYNDWTVSITGTNAAEFTVISNSCTGVVAGPTSCAVTVAFCPSLPPGSRSATLIVGGVCDTSVQPPAATNAGNTFFVPLTGTSA